MTVPELLDRLESHYGPQKPSWPVDPYEFLIWWHCGYPASDVRCARGWEELQKIGISPAELLAASPKALTAALKPGGMVPELRALRLKEIAQRVEHEFGGDFRRAMKRAALKKFPNIGDPGADRILLFGGVSPLAAVPSNCPHVLVRIQRGNVRLNYGVVYRQAQEAIELEVARTPEARQRAFLLLKEHGQALCKAAKPTCGECPVRAECRFTV